MLPNVKPAAYGLGKSGWIAAEFPDGKLPPIDVLKAWIDESYRAQAPKKLLAELTTPAKAAAPAPKKKAAAKKKPAAKKKAMKKSR